jgi:glycogen debranching enzyme
MSAGQDVLTDLGIGLSREWVLGNGLGGSASGTASGVPTRSVHAHLVTAGPFGRTRSLLLKLEERLVAQGGTFELGNDPHGGSPHHPAGWRLLEDFRAMPWPTWRFRAGQIVLEKTLFLIHGHNAVAIAYRQLGGPEGRLIVSPLVAVRDPGTIQHELPDPLGAVQGVPGRIRFEMTAGGPALTLWHSGAFMPVRAWRRQLHYAEDARAGRETGEDAFVPGYIEAPLAEGGTLHLVAAEEDQLMRELAREDRLGTPPPRTLAECVAALETDERAGAQAWRRKALEGASITMSQAHAARTKPAAAGTSGAEHATTEPRAGFSGGATRFPPPFDSSDPWVASLADAFRMGLVRRGGRVALLSSLPRAEERGRDALRAVSGLVTLRGFEAARAILQGFIEYLDEGLAPEDFDPDDGTPRYGDPEPSLWLAIAGELYARRSQDHEFARDVLYPALEGMTRAYRSGTRHGIRVDADGLLVCSENGSEMKRADLNALWYHASVAVAQLARVSGRKETGAFHLAWAHEHQRRFNEALWDERDGCLYHALDARGDPVRGLAPSQLVAVSRPPPMLPPERVARLLETIARDLFTPLGLRERQGEETVSTEWLGSFFSAYLRAHDDSAPARRQVQAWLEILRAWLEESTCGPLPVGFRLTNGVSALTPLGGGGIEMARPTGDPVSVVAAAELLRVWVEKLEPSP